MNNKLLVIAFGGALTLASVGAGCAGSDDIANSTESALKGGKASPHSDGGMARCKKSKKPKHGNGSNDRDDDADESDTDADGDERAEDGGRAHSKDLAGKPAAADHRKRGEPADDDESDAGDGKINEAKPSKSKGAQSCLDDDGTVGEEAEDDSDEDDSDEDDSDEDDSEHGKGGNGGKGHRKEIDAGA